MSSRGSKVVAASISALMALGVAEMLTRVMVPDPHFTFENRVMLFVPDPHAGYRNRPNYRAHAQGVILVRTNSLGFRGEEVAREKAPDTFRVLALGDSVTWGVGVPEAKTFPQMLEQGLRRAAPDRRFEVVNAGVIGYSLHQELLALRHTNVDLAPDVVLINYTQNDFYPTEDPFFNVHGFHQPARDRVSRRIYNDPPPPTFYFLRLLRSAIRRNLARWTSEPKPSVAPLASWPPDSFEMRGWPTMQEHFRQLKQLRDERGFRLVVVLFPTATQLRAGVEHAFPQSLIETFLRDEGIAYLDLQNTLRGRDRDAFLDDMHLAAIGHGVVAVRIERFLSEQGWLPPPVAPTDGKR